MIASKNIIYRYRKFFVLGSLRLQTHFAKTLRFLYNDNYRIVFFKKFSRLFYSDGSTILFKKILSHQ